MALMDQEWAVREKKTRLNIRTKFDYHVLADTDAVFRHAVMVEEYR